jgi:hypothetical protein
VRSITPRNIPLTPHAMAHAASTNWATSPEGNPYPMKTIRLLVKIPLRRIVIGGVRGPDVVKCGCSGKGCGDAACGAEKQFTRRMTENYVAR